VLADEVVDQIAAGEVVERPASVLRELLDNAVDAGARRIEVEFVGGGIERLAVRDDGCGIPAAQVPLALLRHATSKIRTADELLEVGTLGFRGEALPSIASVSRFRLTSRPAEALVATRIELQGGRDRHLEEVGAPVGTLVEVDDLFFNVPARRKFLSTPRTEANHLLEVCRRLVLSRPELHLVVREDGREVLFAPPAVGLPERLAVVFGRSAAARLFPFARPGSLVVATGYLSPPDLLRRTSDGIYLFVNGRHVRDRGLQGVLRAGYGGLTPAGTFPLATVFLELPAPEVDVNVHPQKAEVRFRNKDAVFGSLNLAVRAALAGTPWLPRGLDAPGAVSTVPAPLPAGEGSPARLPAAALGERPAPYAATGSLVAPDRLPRHPVQVPAAPGGSLPAGPAARWQPGLDLSFVLPEPSSAVLSNHDPATGDGPGPGSGPPAPGDEPAPGPGYFGQLRLLGQAGDTWLVCEGAAGLVIIDQHAAHERVTYERLRQARQGGRIPGQAFLLPPRVELSPAAERTLATSGPLLLSLGIELEPFGGATWLVKSVPAALVGGDAARLVADLLEELGSLEGLPPGVASGELPPVLAEKLDHLLATMACHGSVRAGQPLAPAESRALLQALDRVDFRGHCPHGRPVLAELSFEELQRRMKRR
jgi:DNA mismatch repair protein MutL